MVMLVRDVLCTVMRCVWSYRPVLVRVGTATSSMPPATVTADAAARAARASAGDIVSSLVMQERFVEATEAVHDMEAREKLTGMCLNDLLPRDVPLGTFDVSKG
jgi:hypothetical protein